MTNCNMIQGGVPLKPCNKIEAIKVHRTTILSSPTVNTWTDFTSFTEVETEGSGQGLSLNADGRTIDSTLAGLFQFGGCVHIQNNTAGIFSGVTVLTRLLKNGTTEAKCSQREFTQNIAANGARVLSYNGTDLLSVGDSLTLQYWTDEATLDFFSNSNFDQQIAATLWLNYLGVPQ